MNVLIMNFKDNNEKFFFFSKRAMYNYILKIAYYNYSHITKTNMYTNYKFQRY